jgi:uncharacterized protein (TIRG00374 family)
MPGLANTPPRGPGESRAGVVRAVVVFVLGLALGFGGLYLVAGDKLLRIETYRVRDPSLVVVALCVAAFIAEWFVMDPARIWLLCRKQNIPLRFRSAVLVHLTSMFVASVTPGNVGVGPVIAVTLRRLGVPLGKGIGVAIQVFIFDLIFFAWAVPSSLGYLIYSNTLRLPPASELAAFTIAGLAIVGAVFLTRYPRPVVRLILVAARWPFLDRFASRLRKVARDYYRSAIAFRNLSLFSWLMINVVVAAGWFSGFVLFWLLLKLYGVEVGLLATLAILTSVTLVSHLFPTPGGSGFMEAALGLSIGAGGGAAAALLLWRLASYHAIFLLGPPAAWLLYVSKPVMNSGVSEHERGKEP